MIPLISATIVSNLDFCNSLPHFLLSGLWPHSCSYIDHLWCSRVFFQIRLLLKSFKAFSLNLITMRLKTSGSWQPNLLDLAFESCLLLRQGNTWQPNAERPGNHHISSGHQHHKEPDNPKGRPVLLTVFPVTVYYLYMSADEAASVSGKRPRTSLAFFHSIVPGSLTKQTIGKQYSNCIIREVIRKTGSISCFYSSDWATLTASSSWPVKMTKDNITHDNSNIFPILQAISTIKISPVVP